MADKYFFKSGLTKTQVYNMASTFNPFGFQLPSIRKCIFKHYRNAYWLNFQYDDYDWRVYVSSCAGGCFIKFQKYLYDWDSGASVRCKRETVFIPFQYLVDNDFLRKAV
ncbi:MAG TPA: hypothetical protein IAA07_11885 [Candidatus Lachnoclostridium stercoravium]|uniref:Uncharacterized protein n=1 Tax=Candidatus Lachnoclostridium stercoravium TaxID=2838633 RepID=A0A9D2HK07_9FIRM|nr:hypothetical protein [Candidatus Lachnoclostridium stercoravium]